jgi:hypothetical protein
MPEFLCERRWCQQREDAAKSDSKVIAVEGLEFNRIFAEPANFAVEPLLDPPIPQGF